MAKASKDFRFQPFKWKNDFLIDFISSVFLICLNLVSFYPFLGQPDKANIFSAPLLPVFSHLINHLTGFGLAQSVTLSLLIFAVLGPVSLYYFTAKLMGRRLSGLTAALIYSLPAEWLSKGRLRMIFLTGDGGHITALTFIPIIALLLLVFLKRGRFRYLVSGSLGMGLVALTSPFGLLICLIVLTVTAFSEFLQGQGRLKILRFLFFIGLAIGLVAFWYNPVFVMTFLKSQQGLIIKKTFFNLVPISFVVVPILGAFGFLLFEKKARLQPLFIALGLVILFSLISFASQVGQLFPSHPRRYLPELGFSIAFLLGVLATAFSDYLKFKGRFCKVKLTPLGRSLAQKAFWLSSAGLIGAITAFSLDSVWELVKAPVLGAWTEEIETGGAWVIRKSVDGSAGRIGYWISFLTIFLTAFLWLRVSRQVKKGKSKQTP
jgi:hypothetical protein